jgi:hypothetical protein
VRPLFYFECLKNCSSDASGFGNDTEGTVVIVNHMPMGVPNLQSSSEM